MPRPLKPPAMARRIPAFRPRRTAPRVPSDAAVEVLFGAAEILAEGALHRASPRWYGSVMFTIDLATLRRRCRDLSEDADLEAFLEAVEGSVRCRLRIHRAARAEVQRRFPDRALGTATVETAFERRGDVLLIDVDLEVDVTADARGAVPSRGAASS
jgi:hypothetical protein